MCLRDPETGPSYMHKNMNQATAGGTPRALDYLTSSQETQLRMNAHHLRGRGSTADSSRSQASCAGAAGF